MFLGYYFGEIIIMLKITTDNSKKQNSMFVGTDPHPKWFATLVYTSLDSYAGESSRVGVNRWGTTGRSLISPQVRYPEGSGLVRAGVVSSSAQQDW